MISSFDRPRKRIIDEMKRVNQFSSSSLAFAFSSLSLTRSLIDVWHKFFTLSWSKGRKTRARLIFVASFFLLSSLNSNVKKAYLICKVPSQESKWSGKLKWEEKRTLKLIYVIDYASIGRRRRRCCSLETQEPGTIEKHKWNVVKVFIFLSKTKWKRK